jgi:LytS/YehU family sensor histidine kinase
VFLLREWESDRLRSAKVEHARLQTELESLGREVDAHFLFNNLNALAHLIETRRDEAVDFIRTLSTTYRYVLDCRGRALVPLADEILALQRHHALARIRYGTGVSLAVEIAPADAARWRLPPVSLGELFHNALKHNTIGRGEQLCIRLYLDGSTLVFENDAAAAAPRSSSTGIGLANLRDRFHIASGQPIRWGFEARRFVVRLPLVRREDAGRTSA